jgi:hypothetical protein
MPTKDPEQNEVDLDPNRAFLTVASSGVKIAYDFTMQTALIVNGGKHKVQHTMCQVESGNRCDVVHRVVRRQPRGEDGFLTR